MNQNTIEESFLYCIVTDENEFEVGCNQIDLTDFVNPDNKKLFKVLKTIYENKETPDSVLISKYSDSNEVETYQKVLNDCIGCNNFESYLKVLKEETTKRNLKVQLNKILKTVDEDVGTAFKMIDEVSREEYTDNTNTVKSMEELVPELTKIMYNEVEEGIKTGYKTLDVKTKGGFKKGQLITIGAYTGRCKTMVALNLVKNLILDNKKVLYFSLEMQNTETISKRLIPMILNHSYESLKGTVEGCQTYSDNTAYLQNLGLWIDDTTNQAEKIIGICRSMKRKIPDLDCIFIDYLQILEMNKSYSRDSEIGNVTKRIKRLAMELQVPIVMLCQLNRNALEREEQGLYPVLSNLRESGSIENDSDIVILQCFKNILGEDQEIPEGEPIKMLQILAKNRQGDRNVPIHLTMNPKTLNITEEPKEEGEEL